MFGLIPDPLGMPNLPGWIEQESKLDPKTTLKPHPDLVKGLLVIGPTLVQHGFALEHFQHGWGETGRFSIATFRHGHKRISLHFTQKLGAVIYHYADFQVSHSAYLEHLGFAAQRRLPDFPPKETLSSFHLLLHDFAYLTEDFFQGACTRLGQAAQIEAETVQAKQRQQQQAIDNHPDIVLITQARQKFKQKDFKACLACYAAVRNQWLMKELDQRYMKLAEGRV